MMDPRKKTGGPGQPGAAEPRFGEAEGMQDQPMYATEPEAAHEADRPVGGTPAGQQPSGDGQAPAGGAADSRAPGQQAQPEAAAQLEEALAAAQARAKEAEEQYLRALAEMENVRRRAREDVAKAHKFAIESFAESLLPVRDSLEMALSTEVPSIESLKEGVETTLRQLTQAFERNNLTVIDPLHQKFDPNRHQAISTVPAKDVAPNHVASVLQKGYMINDRVLRPALVTVSQSG
jgi:molecular chaperone GrpE